MQVRKQLFPALCIAGLMSLSPSVVLSQSYTSQSNQFDRMAKSEMAQNYAPTQFFSQAERDLVQRVRDQYEADPILAPLSRDIVVGVEVDTVSLGGSVPTQVDKERALAVTKRVLGVEHVVDSLRVTNTASMSAPAQSAGVISDAGGVTSQTSGAVANERLVVVEQPVVSFPATERREREAVGVPTQFGSGRLAEEDRTGTTGPSGSRNVSSLTTGGAVDTIGRVAKSAGDYAITDVDRGLVSQIRVALDGNPHYPVTPDNTHFVVDNGYVTLHGWVPSEQDRVAINERVARIGGVQGINNQLQVRPQEGYLSRR